MMAKRKSTSDAPDLSHIAEGLRGLAWPIKDLNVDPRNARSHSETNVAAIAASLKRFGQLKPAVGNRATGRLEAGHGMMAAARKLGWTHLAVIWVEHSERDARDFGLSDNRTAELAEWNDAVLAELLDELRQEDDSQEFYDAMLLAELEADDDLPAAGDAAENDVAAEYGAVVIVPNEREQKRLLQEMEERGYQCRALM